MGEPGLSRRRLMWSSVSRAVPGLNVWLRRPAVTAAITLAFLVLGAAVDVVTGPQFDVTILYFIPVTYAAWSLGRAAASTVAVLASLPTLAERFRPGSSTTALAHGIAAEVVVPLLMYLFVAHIVHRLSSSVALERNMVVQLRHANQETETLYQRMAQDLEVARRLQQGILTLNIPSIPGCDFGVAMKYAAAVGGDFVDIGTLNGRAFVCVADVSGKGMPAALFTALLKHLLTDAHKRRLSGSAVVDYINSAMSLNLPTDRFLTLFYAEVDEQSGKVRYVNAGHPAGLVYRADSKSIEEASPTNSVLGIPGVYSYKAETAEIALGDGDVLVLYTDGATESKTVEGKFLGDDLIQQLAVRYAHLGAQEMAERISSDLLSQVDRSKVDDVSIVCLKLGRVAPVADP